MNPGCRVKYQLNINKSTAPYIIGRELNIRKLPGRQWESNPQSSEQLHSIITVGVNVREANLVKTKHPKIVLESNVKKANLTKIGNLMMVVAILN